MKPVIEDLVKRAPALIDGAWGTQLQTRGLPIGACPDEWNLSNPDKVKDVAAAYVSAGSDIILTNTFGANRLTLGRHGFADRAVEINKAGVSASLSAVHGTEVRVFASIGPTGVMLAMGESTPEELLSVFTEQATALAEAGAHGIVVETMSDIDEATIAVKAAVATGLPVVASMVYGAGKALDRTIMGVTPEMAAEALESAGADVIGSNCGQGADTMLIIAQRLKAATKLPLWIKPNAGLPELVDGAAVYRTSPEEWAVQAGALVSAGADFIGGCCGTSPVFITALTAALSKGTQ
ncbi:MAG TPA: homocysteine S-methyltransferase family protein [Armatimonadota bacterium]|jgi:5-methyltetrahydrofolate--homocysteine methyltransferase|nr:homocysteine S-methyltransferase family protein [Armatimonadota bacterium]